MIIKINDRQLSFLFQETDPYFEIGYKILEQAKIDEMLPYKRKQYNGREKINFLIEQNYVQLSQIIGTLSNNDLIDILYELIFLTQKVEENGFLKKECIWFKYDHIYYDIMEKRPKVAILPITKEFNYIDNLSWYGRYEEMIINISRYLSEIRSEHVKKLFKMMRSNKLSCDEVLNSINLLGNGNSGLLVNKTEELPDTELQLIYSGREGRIEFNIISDEYIIGKNAEIADGIISDKISKAVSRRHCMITKMNRKFFVQDLNSSNRTLVNGIMIPAYELMELSNNDILSVADVEFRVKLKEKKAMVS